MRSKIGAALFTRNASGSQFCAFPIDGRLVFLPPDTDDR